MTFLSSLEGIVTLEVTSADPEALLQLAMDSGISISHIQKKTELSILFTIPSKTYPVFSQLCEKQGAKLVVLRRTGIHRIFRQTFSRPVLIIGLLALFFSFQIISSRIFFVKIQGNSTVPTRKILQAAQENGLHFGASRRTLRSEQVKNALLSAIPDLEWVGVNTAGCVASVSVRERSDAAPPKTDHSVSHIVASQDGFLISIDVTSGTSLCRPGQQVKKGQVLVSGYTDCGLYIQAAAAEAEVYAQTSRELEVITPSQATLRTGQTRQIRKFSLLIGKKRINLWKGSGILDTTCGRIYQEKYASLPGGFQLPLALCIEEFTFYDTVPIQYEEAQKADALCDYAQAYLTQHMTAGRILSSEYSLETAQGCIWLRGAYSCQEMIGRTKQEQIGEHYVQNN